MTRSARTACWAGLASAGVVLSLRPLVVTSGWLVPALAVVAAVTGSGILLRALTRRTGVAVLGQVLVLLVATLVLFGGGTTLLGVVPTPATPGRFVQLVGDGIQVVQRYSVPAVDLRGLRLLLVSGAGLAALAVDLLAVTLRRPALAGVPLAAVYAVPLALAPGGSSASAFLVAAVPYLVLLAVGRRRSGWPAALHGVRRAGTGAVTATTGTSARSAAGATAGVTAVVALLAAVAVPAVAPDLDERPLTIDTGSGDTIAVINPILNLKASLGARSDATILTYQTDQQDPAPLRIVTADVFDGETWAPSTGGDIPRSQRVQDGLPTAPGLSDAERAQAVPHSTQISVRGLDQTYLPLPYPAERVAIAGDWLYEAESLNVVGDGETTRNRRYTVTHLDVEPTEDELRTAAPAPDELREKYTALPDDLPQSVRDAAVQVTQGARDPYEQAAALQRYFRSTGGFTYSTSAPNDGGSNAVATFLAEKTGFCVQFASAMAVMSRSLGIPARVAIGFLPGEEVADGSWRISAQDAHAWPELYFEGTGWVRFEPTPATRTGQSPSYSVPAAPLPTPTASASTAPALPQATSAAPTASASATSSAAGGAGADAQRSAADRFLALPWGWILGGLLVLLALLLPVTSSALLARRRWSRASGTSGAAEAAWADLEDRTRDLGARWAPSDTPRQSAAAVESLVALPPEAVEELTRLRRAVESARFGAGSMTAAGPGTDASSGVASGGVATLERTATAQARVVRSQVDHVVAAISARRPRVPRWRARWLPSAGTRALLRWWDRS
ncbi:transglutaminase TgpA family protein [Kineococcus rubinsiae]|uniref:transglutaminase TgpA family protein n=1 Tax=Kineococcus rubinsiae TaxID=2609562 RepID=UPI00143071C0|nr:transglutaminaseTgpA domain-containing protein [Kineococcus rubinsiae]NIZ92930.1 transglutaminase domain-containing protein [Kineococcus rubinsiae]